MKTHPVPKAVLLSIEDFNALVKPQDARNDALSRDEAFRLIVSDALNAAWRQIERGRATGAADGCGHSSILSPEVIRRSLDCPGLPSQAPPIAAAALFAELEYKDFFLCSHS